MERLSSPYAELDGAIARWTEQSGLTLCREWQGDARFWYISRESECFQIAVDRPVGDRVTLHAWSVETVDDAELHEDWTVGLTDLEQGLATAAAQIHQWAARKSF